MRRLLLLAFALTACNVVPRVDVTPAYGLFDVSGDFAASDTGILVEQSFDDIGIDDEEAGPLGRVTFNWLGVELMVAAFQADYAGSGTTTAALSLDGDVINVGADVDTELDLTYLTGAVTFDVIPGDMVDLGLGVGVTALDFDLSVTEPGSGETVQADEVLPLPELAAHLAVRFGPAAAHARVGYVTGEYGDFDGTLLDADLSAQLRVLGEGKRVVTHVTAGYRLVDLDFDYDDGDDQVEADFEVSGPYIGLTFSL